MPKSILTRPSSRGFGVLSFGSNVSVLEYGPTVAYGKTSTPRAVDGATGTFVSTALLDGESEGYWRQTVDGVTTTGGPVALTATPRVAVTGGLGTAANFLSGVLPHLQAGTVGVADCGGLDDYDELLDVQAAYPSFGSSAGVDWTIDGARAERLAKTGESHGTKLVGLNDEFFLLFIEGPELSLLSRRAIRKSLEARAHQIRWLVIVSGIDLLAGGLAANDFQFLARAATTFGCCAYVTRGSSFTSAVISADLSFRQYTMPPSGAGFIDVLRTSNTNVQVRGITNAGGIQFTHNVANQPVELLAAPSVVRRPVLLNHAGDSPANPIEAGARGNLAVFTPPSSTIASAFVRRPSGSLFQLTLVEGSPGVWSGALPTPTPGWHEVMVATTRGDYAHRWYFVADDIPAPVTVDGFDASDHTEAMVVHFCLP